MKNQYNGTQAIELIKLNFPELADEMNDEINKGLIHLEMSCFARHTQQLFNAGIGSKAVEDQLKKCFGVAIDLMKNGDHDVDNAVYVSYLENLDFEHDKRSRLWVQENIPVEVWKGYLQIHGLSK